jgi:hypothetical protein
MFLYWIVTEHYFRSRNLALPQDSHCLRGSTSDLLTDGNKRRVQDLMRLTVVRGGPQAVSEEKILQKLYQIRN